MVRYPWFCDAFGKGHNRRGIGSCESHYSHHIVSWRETSLLITTSTKNQIIRTSIFHLHSFVNAMWFRISNATQSISSQSNPTQSNPIQSNSIHASTPHRTHRQHNVSYALSVSRHATPCQSSRRQTQTRHSTAMKPASRPRTSDYRSIHLYIPTHTFTSTSASKSARNAKDFACHIQRRLHFTSPTPSELPQWRRRLV